MMDSIPIVSYSMILILLFGFQLLLIMRAVNNDLETYIVHVQSPFDVQPATYTDFHQKMDLESWYRSFLPIATRSDTVGEELELKNESRLVYSYQHVFNGFAAKLTMEEVNEMKNKKGFISAQVQEILSIDTTHSPDYLGLIQNSGLWKDSNYGKGVIIGVLDTGIEPNHPSFKDDGISSPPAKWKGKCKFNRTEEAKNRTCNNKLIGIRDFTDKYGSSFDEIGHGTHTASTAAGNYVEGANVYENAKGTARGVAPLAHIAIYKICNAKCFESRIIAAIDLAIKDGVDILSISFGSKSKAFYIDNIAIAAFRAMEKGILVSASIGNKGPGKSSLAKEAPWMLLVGASTTDRKIIAIAKLGNNEELEGQSIYQPEGFSSTLPLVYPESLNPMDDGNPYCQTELFDYIDIKGKIVVCVIGGGVPEFDKGLNVQKAGGAGMILINDEASGYTIELSVHILPMAHLNYVDGERLIYYIKSTDSSTATIIFNGTSIDPSRGSSSVASFSGRGPGIQSPGILKPDILGPGVNILAASPFSVEDHYPIIESRFNILSCTSMACPHLSGVAALLKSVHPDWSPNAIMSAIITTADTVNHQNIPIEDEKNEPASIFATGAGQVNPSKANDPGLVYLIHRINDYLYYLCGLGYTNIQVSIIAKRNVLCSEETSILEAQLNYPSISVFLHFDVVDSVSIQRTVTNVGDVMESYIVHVDEPPGVSVIVEPTTLNFMEIKQNLSYGVIFTRLPTATGEFSQGSLSWISAKHTVRSPIATIFK